MRGTAGMDNRTRILNTILGKPVDRAPFFLFLGPWEQTLVRWRAEGLDAAGPWDAEFRFDPGMKSLCDADAPGHVNLGLCPWFEPAVIEERGDIRVIRDRWGVLEETIRASASLPHHLANPVRSAQDWDRLKAERLDPRSPARFPADWKRIASEANEGSGSSRSATTPSVFSAPAASCWVPRSSW